MGCQGDRVVAASIVGNEDELHHALLQREVACQKFLEGVFRDEWIFFCVFCVGSANTCQLLWVTTYLLESKK